VSGNHGGNDIWIVKVNMKGVLLSQHCYGGTGDDVSYDNCLVKTGMNQYVFAGNTNSTDGDISGIRGGYDAWVVKFNFSWEILWSKSLGGSDDEFVAGLVSTEEKNLLIAGSTNSVDGIISGNHGNGDIYIMRLTDEGKLIYSKCYGGSGYDGANNLAVTSDGNIALAGVSNSNDGDVSGNHGDYDMWIPKINIETGRILWQTCLGTIGEEGAFGIMSTNNNEVIALGETSPDFDYKHFDAQAIKLGQNGSQVWTKTFGGSAGEYAFMGVETGDGLFLIQCNTDSRNGDVTNQHGPGDAWLVEVSNCINTYSMSNALKVDDKTGKTLFSNYPNPFSNTTTISFSLPQSQKVSIAIFDVNGRLIKTLASVQMRTGTHKLVWDARDEQGNAVAAGIYILRFNANNYIGTKKIIVAR
jgi:hypothetical protein